MVRSSLRFLYIVAFFSCSLFSTISYASSTDQPSKVHPVKAELLHEEASIQPGQPFWLAIHLQIEEGWHAYWKNPGDVGMATSIKWELPEGFKAGEIEWPYPQRFTSDIATGFGYENEAILLTEITPPNHLSQDNVTIKAHAKWLVCSDSACLPGGSEVTVALPINSNDPKVREEVAHHFAKARDKLPEKKWDLQALEQNGLIQLALKAPASQPRSIVSAYFCPEDGDLVDHSVDAVFATTPHVKNQYTLTLRSKGSTPDKNLKGVLVLLNKESIVAALDVDMPVTHSQEQEAVQEVAMVSKKEITALSIPTPPIAKLPEVEFEGGVAFAIFLAFVGGMILNLMPCVLPVISFKILSFVKMAGESRSRILKHGLAFSFGVLLSFWVLAGVLLLLQSYGRSVGWGFQLQEPLFVAILAAILFVFGLSLFGILEIGISLTNWVGNVQNKTQVKTGLFSSFMSGILATAVATPCTGPFLGSAVGFAVTLPAIWSMLIFTSLGLGMAFPYLLLSAYPKLIRYLPKPGNWMVTFKELMGFFMLATVLWLIWVFGAQTNTLAIFLLLCGLFFFGIACWIYGRWGTPVNNRITRFFGFLFAFSAMSIGGYAILTSTASWVVEQGEHYLAKSGQPKSGDVDWEEFSPERVAELQAQGIPVFIDFTAKWCLICQTNHLVLSTEDVEKKFKELGVVRMKADWTKNDPVITEELRKFGRNSVPLYVLYGTDSTKAPEILPQVLTPDVVVSQLTDMNKDIATKN
jgi:thiol:disulfide interchange protein